MNAVTAKAVIQTRRGPFDIFIDRSELSDYGYQDNTAIVQHGMLAWLALLSDSPLSNTHGQKPLTVFREFRKELLGRHIKETVLRYADLGDRLLESLSPESEGLTPRFLIEFKDTPVFKEYHEFFKFRNAELLKYLLTFCFFLKKLSYADPQFEAVALRNWLELEEQLSSHSLPSQTVEYLKEILERLLGSSYDNSITLPVHGSGAVAEKGVHGVVEKNTHFKVDFKTFRFLERHRFEVDPLRIIPRYNKEMARKNSDLHHARLAFVPKDLRKARSICMEPISYMWMQQSVRIHFEKSLKRSLLRRWIDINDQGKNRAAARFGSYTDLVDTIDLSSASDSVSWDLVKGIFPRKILTDLALTRSARVELPDGSTFKVKKFAPMGSALCFPVQSTIYAAVVILATYIRESTRLKVSIPSLMQHVPIDELFYPRLQVRVVEGKYEPFNVYGDDIICDKRTTSIVIDLLTSLGFSINVEKSFFASPFRESCGGYYYHAEDVTPLRYSVKRWTGKVSAEALAGLMKLANAAGDRGLRTLQKFLINTVLRYPLEGVSRRDGINPILFTDNPDGGFSLFSTKPRNTHLRSRSYATAPEESTAKRFQRDEVRSFGLKPEQSRSYREDQYEYIAWQRSTLFRDEDVPIQGTNLKRVTSGTRLGWRWTPA